MNKNGWIAIALTVIAGFLLTGLLSCEPKTRQAAPNAEQLVCLDCHRQANTNTNEGIVASNAFCDRCHTVPENGKRLVDGQTISLQVPAETFDANAHKFVACIHCHTDVARSPHKTEIGAQCLRCHSVHGENEAHAPHLRLDCQTCHFTYDAVTLDDKTHRVVLARTNDAGMPMALTDHRLSDAEDEAVCRRCHASGNKVGAPASVLPAKSVLCVLCHPAPLAIGHPIFWIALLIFTFGCILMVRFWFTGSVQGEEKSLHRKIALSSDAVWQTIFSRKIWMLGRIFLLDIILQRRILKESVQRWSIHSLIFLPIVLRFALSVFTGLVFAVSPDSDLALALIDKNDPATAFVYDLLGLFIFLGVLWAAIRRLVIRPANVTAEFEDNTTLVIMGGIAVFGFLTTAVRLLMTQVPEQTAIYSFVSYPLAKIIGWLPFEWTGVYPVVWYIHALFGAALVAYLPYGKLKHIFNVPLTYFIEAITGVKKDKRV